MIEFHQLPTVNALINSCSFILLLSGYYFIRQKNIKAHKICMLGAVLMSFLFMWSYITYHSNVGSVKFMKEGWIRPVYFTILISHTILASMIIPLAGVTVYRGLKNQVVKHVKIARWTLPIWLYISCTGVIIYLMLYHL